MIDVIDRAADALEAVGISPVLVRPLASKEEGVTIRKAPSTVVQTYMDGQQDVSYLMTVYSRHESESKAIEECELAADVLREADLSSDNGSYSITSVEVYSDVTDISHEDGLHTWAVGIRANITIY